MAHLLDAVGAGVAEALASLEVALAVDAVAADEGTVLPVRPVPALGFTAGERGGQAAEAPMPPGTCSIPLRGQGGGGCVLAAPFV